MAITPVKLFGKDNMVVVFGNMLFWGGIGALFGAPIAGETFILRMKVVSDINFQHAVNRLLL